MLKTKAEAERYLQSIGARLHKTAANGSRFVFYVPRQNVYIAVDGIGGGNVKLSTHASCPACR